MTLGDWLDKWLSEYKAPMIRENTANGYRRYIDNHIKPYLGDKPITQMTTADVQKMYNTLKESGRIREDAAMGKTLSNSMSSVFGNMSRDELNAAIERAGAAMERAGIKDAKISPNVRGETLSVVQLAAIANELV